MTSPKSLPFAAAALLSGLTLATAAHAQYTIKVGAIYIDPRATSSGLYGTLPANAGPTTYLGNTTDGIYLQVQPQTTLEIAIERAFDEHWSAELVLGYPPRHDVKLKSTSPQITSSTPGVATLLASKIAADDGEVVARVRQWAPTAFINYKFFDKGTKLRPYIGVGVNYTMFKSSATEAGTSLYNDGQVRIKLTNSFGLAFQTGVSYQFNDQWSLNMGWATAAVKNHITIYTDNSKQEADYRFHPSTYSLTVGYSF